MVLLLFHVGFSSKQFVISSLVSSSPMTYHLVVTYHLWGSVWLRKSRLPMPFTQLPRGWRRPWSARNTTSAGCSVGLGPSWAPAWPHQPDTVVDQQYLFFYSPWLVCLPKGKAPSAPSSRMWLASVVFQGRKYARTSNTCFPCNYDSTPALVVSGLVSAGPLHLTQRVWSTAKVPMHRA